MASTKKTTTSEPKEKLVVDKEKEELKQQIAEMQAQMKLMMQSMTAPKESNVNKKERNITFINMTTGTVVLKGTKIWEIAGQFEKRSFLEREARLIVNNTRNLVVAGSVYIPDTQFVEENELVEAYKEILSDEDLKQLLNNNVEYVIETYKNVSESQKDIIISMISEKKLNGEKIDNNILVELGKLSGKDLLNIESDDE